MSDAKTDAMQRLASIEAKVDGLATAFQKMIEMLATRPAAKPAASSPRGGGMLLPNYGRSKGQPVSGASMQDLEFYANGCRRSLDDPSKSRWHDKERQLLAAIEDEIDRQSRGERTESNGDHHHHNEQTSQSGADDMLDDTPF